MIRSQGTGVRLTSESSSAFTAAACVFPAAFPGLSIIILRYEPTITIEPNI